MNSNKNNFFTNIEKKISKDFLNKGYLIFNVENKKFNLEIKDRVKKITSQILKKKNINLDMLHKFISKKDINDFRLEVISKINNYKSLREKYFILGRDNISILAGNELVMQKNINLSIQLPNDETSLLPIHSDVWSGDSPYEINLWLPLVDCYKTKSMYILDKRKIDFFYKLCKSKRIDSSDKIFNHLKNKLTWLNINYGKALLFDQSLPHGNIINKEKSTRWSMNCRFKSIFSPYGDKKVGEFFSPITTRAMTKVGFNYKFPFKNN